MIIVVYYMIIVNYCQYFYILCNYCFFVFPICIHLIQSLVYSLAIKRTVSLLLSETVPLLQLFLFLHDSLFNRPDDILTLHNRQDLGAVRFFQFPGAALLHSLFIAVRNGG